jgi:ABC-type multidrug transport system fused ATPase/permease subunit
MSTNISMAVRSIVFIIVVLVFLCVLSWQLTLVTFCAIIPIIGFMSFYGKRMRVISKQVQEEKALMNTSAEESFSNVRTVKAFSNEIAESEKFGKGN